MKWTVTLVAETAPGHVTEHPLAQVAGRHQAPGHDQFAIDGVDAALERAVTRRAQAVLTTLEGHHPGGVQSVRIPGGIVKLYGFVHAPVGPADGSSECMTRIRSS
jgi:hypothetical protein